MKILLVEDDKLTGELFSKALSAHRYAVDLATDGQIGLELAQGAAYDVIVLDVMIPKIDGISLCRRLRADGCQQPIILLTVQDSSTDVIMGLDAGADEYVTKPCQPSELLARIRALMRRAGSPTASSLLTWGDLCLDPTLVQVSYAGQEIDLTPKEYQLLQLFLSHPQRVFSRSIIIDQLWSMDQIPSEAAVTNLIKDLRRGLRAAGMETDLIETVYGMGYRLKALPDHEQPQHDDRTKADSNRLDDQCEMSLTPTSAQETGLASVTSVMDRFRDTFTEQVVVVEEALSALQIEQLSDELRQMARQEAHKLAGGLGTFGWSQGSILARQIEQLLQQDSRSTSLDAVQLKQMVTALKLELTRAPVSSAEPRVRDPLMPVVLVIDHNVALVNQLCEDAHFWGMRVEGVSDPAIAQQRIAQLIPDAILVDPVCAGSDEAGLMLLHNLLEWQPQVPVLVFTAKDSLEHRVAVSRLGGRRFLSKPIAVSRIFRAIAHVLSQAGTTQGKVLAVDDHSAALSAISRLLQPWGLTVEMLQDSRQFWDVLNTFQPELLLLDIEMPSFSGIDLCQVVRQDSKWDNLPIVVVTAHTDSESIRRIFSAGANDIISKPISGSELVTAVMGRLNGCDRYGNTF